MKVKVCVFDSMASSYEFMVSFSPTRVSHALWDAKVEPSVGVIVVVSGSKHPWSTAPLYVFTCSHKSISWTFRVLEMM